MDKRDDDDSAYWVAALALIMTLIGAVCVGGLYFKKVRDAKARGPTDPQAERLAAAIRTHPDPDVGRDFLGRDGQGGVRIVFEDLPYADGLFTVVDGRPELGIKPSLAEEAKTAEGMQKLWGVLSHEHAHFLQWQEGASHVTAVRPLNETNCALAITVEIDAYGKACRDARTYHWDNVLYQCDAIKIESIAAQKVADFLPQFPECENVWRFFAGKTATAPVESKSAPVTRPAQQKAKPAPPAVERPSVERASTSRTPTYLAPP